MEFATPLIRGRLQRRYNRFLADVVLDSGETVTAHCPNSGSMMGLCAPGLPVWLEPNDNPKRKLRYGWRLVELEHGHWAGIDTQTPNRVVGEALRVGRIDQLSGYERVRAEVPYGTRSRIDFLLETADQPPTYVEVKNVHLRRGGRLAEFPDCVTARGTKHLGELAAVATSGARAVMLYVVQRTDCDRLAMAADLDPAYAEAFVEAREAGVEMIAYRCMISTAGVSLDAAIAVE